MLSGDQIKDASTEIIQRLADLKASNPPGEWGDAETMTVLVIVVASILATITNDTSRAVAVRIFIKNMTDLVKEFRENAKTQGYPI